MKQTIFAALAIALFSATVVQAQAVQAPYQRVFTCYGADNRETLAIDDQPAISYQAVIKDSSAITFLTGQGLRANAPSDKGEMIFQGLWNDRGALQAQDMSLSFSTQLPQNGNSITLFYYQSGSQKNYVFNNCWAR